jgi:hypothetical protein
MEEYLKVNPVEKIKRIFCLTVTRKGNWNSWIWPLITLIFGVIWVFIIKIETKFEFLNQLIKWTGGIISFLLILFKIISFIQISKNPAIKIFDSISRVPSFKDVLGVQAEIQKELVNLIKTWKKQIGDKKILLFIDDLDRCSEKQLIDIIDSLRIMLDDKEINQDLLILVALDEAKLKNAIEDKYETLKDSDEMAGIANEYMDKLFISAIKLFPISIDERQEYIKKIASQINGEGKPPKQPAPKSASTSEQDDKAEEIKPEPPSNSEMNRSTKNLEPNEITLLENKVKLAKSDMTPRQIRILIYRYLLARNLWRAFKGVSGWNIENAISEIMRFSELNILETKEETTIDSDLSKITRLVVAY